MADLLAKVMTQQATAVGLQGKLDIMESAVKVQGESGRPKDTYVGGHQREQGPAGHHRSFDCFGLEGAAVLTVKHGVQIKGSAESVCLDFSMQQEAVRDRINHWICMICRRMLLVG